MQHSVHYILDTQYLNRTVKEKHLLLLLLKLLYLLWLTFHTSIRNVTFKWGGGRIELKSNCSYLLEYQFLLWPSTVMSENPGDPQQEHHSICSLNTNTEANSIQSFILCKCKPVISMALTKAHFTPMTVANIIARTISLRHKNSETCVQN